MTHTGLPPFSPPAAGATPPGVPAPAAPLPPAPSPVATMANQDGRRKIGEINVGMAMKILESSLPLFGVTSPEGSALLTALKSLSRHFSGPNEQNKPLVPANVLQMLAAMKGSSPAPAPHPSPAGLPPA